MSIALKPWAFAIICSFMSVAAANGQTRAARAPSRPAVPDAASVQRPPAPPVPAAAPTPPARPAAAAPLVPPAAQTAPAPPTPPAPPAAPVPPLKVLIVISRYQGEKKVASMPYTLSIGGGNMNRASVRMGGRSSRFRYRRHPRRRRTTPRRVMGSDLFNTRTSARTWIV